MKNSFIRNVYKFALVALLAIAGPARGVDLVTVTIAPTNATSSGNGVTINGTLRYGSNALSGSTWITNASPATSATNLLANLQNFQINLAWSIQMTNTNTIVIYGAAPITASITAGWGVLTVQTNSGTNHHALMLPYKTNPPTTKTNDVSDLVEAIGSSVPTNTVPPTAPAFAPFLNTTTSQTASNKTLVGGVLDGARGTNLVGLHGTVNRLSNGYFASPVLYGPTNTNSVHFGITAPGASGNGSAAWGGSATADFATAVSGTASGTNSTAIGFDSAATATDSAAFGSFAEANGIGSLVLGTAGGSDADYGVVLGPLGAVFGGHTKSVVIGYAIQSSAANQITIGDAGYTVRIPGRIEPSGTITNSTHTGMNQWNGDLAWVSAAYSSMANTNNTVPASNNTVYYLSGSTTAHDIAGAAGGRSNLRVRYWDSGTLPLTIRNLGGGASAGSRIRTRTGNDVTLTNNPACFELEYSATASEWLYIPMGN